jgi:hypothetical protein
LCAINAIAGDKRAARGTAPIARSATKLCGIALRSAAPPITERSAYVVLPVATANGGGDATSHASFQHTVHDHRN